MNFWHSIEILIIIVVIIVQIIHTIKVSKNISKLKDIFLYKLSLKKGFVEKSRIGALNFSSNDIHYEDEIDLDDESFSEVINGDMVKLPLIDTEGQNEIITNITIAINTYLINNFGASVNFSIIKDIVDREIEVADEEVTQSISLPLYLGLAATMIGIIFGLFSMPSLSGTGFQNGVDALINGVKIAMIGSLCGLTFTTYLSSYAYKKAKRILQRDKNKQMTYLQATLLPELLKAEDTGVSGLKASLDRFARVATDIVKVADKTGVNLELQHRVIEKVDKMDMLKVSKWNLDLFEKMENNMESFNQFSTYLERMEQISSNLVEFSNRTSDITKIVDNIDSSINESRNLNRFVSSHLSGMKNFGDASLKSIGVVESHFEKAMQSLDTRTQGMIDQINKSTGSHEANLEKIYSDIQLNLTQMTTQYIETFEGAFSDSIPSFRQLDKLDTINTSLQQLQNNRDVLNKMDEMNYYLNKKSQRNNSISSNGEQFNTKSNNSKPLQVGEMIKDLFSNQK